MPDANQKPRIPRTLARLRIWLRDTETGRELLREAAKDILERECSKCQRLTDLPRVLIVLRRLFGMPTVQVYRDTGVTVRLHETVYCREDTAEAVNLIDELLKAELPERWKRLLDTPARRVDEAAFTGITAEKRIGEVERRREAEDWLWLIKEFQKGGE